jgi:putative flippase GtrA
VRFWKNNDRARSWVAYIGVSGLCFVLSNAVLISGDWINCPLVISVTFSYLLTVIVGYVLHSLISFRRPLTTIAFGRYAIGMSFNIPLSYVIVWFWHDFLGLQMLWAAPLATGCATVINFVIVRWAVSGSFATGAKPGTSR